MITFALLALLATSIDEAASSSAAESTIEAVSPSPEKKTQQASVTIKLDIDEKGAVTACEVVKTDASAELANGVCPIFVSKAKYKPKIGEDGTPQKYSETRTIRFVVEN